MADEQHALARCAQTPDQIEHIGDLLHRNRRGRFVHDDHAALEQKRPRDRYDLLLATR
ncbi:MAG: hypothetical protein ACREFO_14120 [Acetobacteraceae bacterium]